MFTGLLSVLPFAMSPCLRSHRLSLNLIEPEACHARLCEEIETEAEANGIAS